MLIIKLLKTSYINIIVSIKCTKEKAMSCTILLLKTHQMKRIS